MTPRAASFSTRVRIERRGAATPDGYGNTLEAWAPVATLWASWRPEFGREALAAGRLESTRRGVLGLRTSSITRALGAADRIVFVTGPEAGSIGNIRSIVPTAETVEATLEIGVAT